MKIVLTGASGYLGRLLIGHFARRGAEVVLISRHTPQLPTRARFVTWDGERQGDWARQLDGADAVINLAGRSVNCRYTVENRREILESRLKTTRAVAAAIQSAERPPQVWLNASGVSIYRDTRFRSMNEVTGEMGRDFAAAVGQDWERAFFTKPLEQTRRVALRLSMVFGREAPVFQTLAQLAKWGLGGAQGTGRQYVSWLHETDFLRAVDFLLAYRELAGPVNLCGPTPLPNREFMRDLRRALQVPVGLPIPRLALDMGARLLHTESELVLKSRRVVPLRLLEAGFSFQFETWAEAVDDLAKAPTPHFS